MKEKNGKGSATKSGAPRDEKAAGKPPAKKFVRTVLLELHKSPADDRGRVHTISVVRWEVDGQKKTPKLERRAFFKDSRTGDLKMFNEADWAVPTADLKLIAPKMAEIMEQVEQGVFA